MNDGQTISCGGFYAGQATKAEALRALGELKKAEESLDSFPGPDGDFVVSADEVSSDNISDVYEARRLLKSARAALWSYLSR